MDSLSFVIEKITLQRHGLWRACFFKIVENQRATKRKVLHVHTDGAFSPQNTQIHARRLIKNSALVLLLILIVHSHLCALLIYNENLLQRKWCLHKNSCCITLRLKPYRLLLLTRGTESIISVLVVQRLSPSHATHMHTHVFSLHPVLQ